MFRKNNRLQISQKFKEFGFQSLTLSRKCYSVVFSDHEADWLFTDKSFGFHIKNECTMIVLQYYLRFLSSKFACDVAH